MVTGKLENESKKCITSQMVIFRMMKRSSGQKEKTELYLGRMSSLDSLALALGPWLRHPSRGTNVSESAFFIFNGNATT